MIRYGSVCSGIEAATKAWHVLGWQAAFFAEVEPFPSAVLAHHYPAVPNRGDITKFEEWPDEAIDLLVGGTPCQSFSIAGLRAGLADPRGNLMLTYLAIAARYRPRWLVWENVPGVLSSSDGRDFAALLTGLGELGYGFAYRVLDAQFCRASGYHFAVPQRRRRVFVVGYLGDWRRAAAVLFDAASLRGNSAPRREAGTGVADLAVSRALTSSHTATGRLDPNESTFIPIAFDTTQITSKANVSNPKPGDPCHPLAAGAHAPAIAFSACDYGNDAQQEFTPTLRVGSGRGKMGGGQQMAVMTNWAVRRLTPRECEHLQGFPDDFTLVPYRGKPAADGPRYKALGNSMAVNVMRVLGERIAMVDAMQAQEAAA